jgi:hypothetical protein
MIFNPLVKFRAEKRNIIIENNDDNYELLILKEGISKGISEVFVLCW